MRFKILTIFSSTALLLLPMIARANVVGYVNITFQTGATLFGNPLDNSDNLLSTVIPSAPLGTTVSLWDPVARDFTQSSVFSSGTWSHDFTLRPGQGALLNAPSPFLNTFVGGVLDPSGAAWSGQLPPLPPPAFNGPDGVYLLSSRLPAALSETTYPVFYFVAGRDPREGEQLTTLDVDTQTYHTTTFTAGAWNNGEPVLQVGQAAFFNLGPVSAPEFSMGPVSVPEPSVLALAFLGLTATGLSLRKRA